MRKLKNEKVSDVISYDMISSWSVSSPVLIYSGTGTGKTYFIMNKLYKYAKMNRKRILLLVNRNICLRKFKNEIGNNDVVVVSTYQKYENFNADDLSNYDYIVCDEFHYFLSDSKMNNRTDISYYKIINSNAIKIFMSATPCAMAVFMNMFDKTDIIKIDSDYKKIRNLYFTEEDDQIDDFVQEVIKNKKKGVLFINNIDKAISVYKKYIDISTFICGKANRTIHSKYVDEGKVDDLLEREMFDTTLLITTTCMDAGINIADSKLSYIYLDVRDIDEIIQCIGRKRFVYDTDDIEVWVRDINKRNIFGMKAVCVDELKRYNDYIDLGNNKYGFKYLRMPDPSMVIYRDINGDYAINELKKFKISWDIERYEEILRDGFAFVLAKELGIGKYKMLSNKQKQVTDFLKGNENKIIISKEDKEQVIIMVNGKNSRGRLIRSISGMSSYLGSINVPYKIVSYKKKISGKTETVWEIIPMV